MKRILLLASALVLSSCNTGIGLWQDTKWVAGKGVEKVQDMRANGLSSGANSSAGNSYSGGASSGQDNYQSPIY